MFEGLFQPMHLILILLIVLIIFGPGKLPELGEGLGKSIKAFKKAIKDEQNASTLEQHTGEKKA
jgi:sec-independent protein translocase protein TatA